MNESKSSRLASLWVAASLCLLGTLFTADALGQLRTRGFTGGGLFGSAKGLTAFKSSAGRADKATSRIGGDFQRHHVIPQQFRNDPVIKRSGFNISSHRNGMFLPTTSRNTTTRTSHMNYTAAHRKYNADIKASLKQIRSDGRKFGYKKADYQREVLKLYTDRRAGLRSGAIRLR